MSNRYPRETVEFLPVTITVDGAPVTTNVELSVVARTARPQTWTTPTTLDGQIGVMVEGYEPATYAVWARITDTPETPVIRAGEFIIT